MGALAAREQSRREVHVLMTLDAVGGVWRYAMDLAANLGPLGYRFTFVGLGPLPSTSQWVEAERLGRLLWIGAPLDWLVDDERELDPIPDLLRTLVAENGIDLVHLNLPSQAYRLQLDVPMLVVSHSCVVTWFSGVRKSPVPDQWQWQFRRNRGGFDAADVALAPSHAHAAMLRASYGAIDGLDVVYNATGLIEAAAGKERIVFAAGRWWDEGKNGATLVAAAAGSHWPFVMAGPDRGPNGQHIDLGAVRSLGEMSHAEVVRWMGRAGIFISPSRYEPFGLAPLEAAKAGTALVLADIPTYRELWDGAALFAAPGDPSAFADAVNRLADNDALRHDFARRARQRSQGYTLEHQAASMSAIYRRLLHLPLAREA
jgi:glycosyltransferase involved in cell wall biosynthesis